MGQKTNPNILRLGVFKDWNSRFFELNKEEHTIFNYQNIQIITFLKKFFNNYKINVNDIKLGYTNKILYIYISYYFTKKFNFFIKNIKSFKLKRKRKLKRFKKPVLRRYKKRFLSKREKFLIRREKRQNFLAKLDLRRKLKNERIKIVSKFKQFTIKKKFVNKKLMKKNMFINYLLETLSLFTKKKYHIRLIFQHLNKGISMKINKKQKKELRKKTLLLKKYSRQKFFNEGLSSMITMVYFNKPVNSFLIYLSDQLRIQKRHKYFLVFLKKTLRNLISLSFSKTKGIKIIINGRFNRRPRARTETIIVGDVPVQTLDKDIKYKETVSYTKDGTFGIKIWLN